MSQLMIVSMLIFAVLPVAVSIGLASLAGVGAANRPGLVVAQQPFAALTGTRSSRSPSSSSPAT